jgi:hypothetical protein
MSFPNIPPSKRSPLAAVIDPQSATTAKTSGYVKVGQGGFAAILATIFAGAFSTNATLDAKLVQAKDDQGTDAKDITGKAITQLTDADTDDNKQAEINCRAEELDGDNGFNHVALVITPATAAVLIAGSIRGFDAAYEPAADVATVDEVVD